MKFLSPKEASQIMDVIDKVEILVKRGKPIHEAFAQAIKEAQLNKDKAHLAVRTWNISQFLANKAVRDEIGLEEELPVVDFEKIRGQIKESREQKKEDEVDPIYLRPPKEEPEAIRFIPHPIFSRFAGVSPRLKYAFEVKAGKVRLWHEVAEWKKLANYIRQELAIKRSQIQNLIREKIIPQLKNPEFDIKIACQHLARTNKGAAAVLVSLVRAKNIDVDGDPYKVKKASYDPRHPFYANLIKVADLIYDVNKLEKLYEGVAKVSRDLFIRFRDRYGVPRRELVSERFEPENKDYGISKNGFYYRKPILNMEVIAPGVVIPNFFRLDERTVKEGAEGEKSRGRPSGQPRREGNRRHQEGKEQEELLSEVAKAKEIVDAVKKEIEKGPVKGYNPETGEILIQTSQGEEVVPTRLHQISDDVLPWLYEEMSRKGFEVDWRLVNRGVQIERLKRLLRMEGERPLAEMMDTLEQVITATSRGEELPKELLDEFFAIPPPVRNTALKLLGQGELGDRKGQQRLREAWRAYESTRLSENLRRKLSEPVEKLKTLFEQVQYDADGKPRMSEDGKRFILQDGQELDPSGISKELLEIVSSYFRKGEPVDWEEVREIYLSRTTKPNEASKEEVSNTLWERQKMIAEKALQEKEREEKEREEKEREEKAREEREKKEREEREKKEREKKRKEYWKQFKKFFTGTMRGLRESVTQITEGITKDRETLQFGKTPLPEAFKAVMTTKIPEIRSDVRGAAEALRPYFARQDMLEQSLKLVTTDPYLAGVRLTGPYAGSRGEVSLPELYRAYTELYQINPELMRDPQVAATVLKKYFAADRALDLSEIIALSKNKPYMSKYGQYPKNPLHGRAIPTSIIFGTAGGLTPLIFVRDKKDLPLSMLIGALLGAGMGYFLGNVFDTPV